MSVVITVMNKNMQITIDRVRVDLENIDSVHLENNLNLFAK